MDKRNYYGETIGRCEPDIAAIDLMAAAPSIAISLKRIADSLDNTTWNAAIEAAAALAASIKADPTSDWSDVENDTVQGVARNIRSLVR